MRKPVSGDLRASPCAAMGFPPTASESALPCGQQPHACHPQGADMTFPHLAPPSGDWAWAPITGCKGSHAFLCVLRSGALPSTWHLFLPNFQGTINGQRGELGALPRAPLAFVRGLWCLLAAGGSVLSPLFCILSLTMTTRCWELREMEPEQSSVLANLWQWALLGRGRNLVWRPADPPRTLLG